MNQPFITGEKVYFRGVEETDADGSLYEYLGGYSKRYSNLCKKDWLI
jgi:hypothetical protein